MPRFSSKEEQEKYVESAIATLGALFGRNTPQPERDVLLVCGPEQVKELTCFCGKPPSKLIVSEDELDELIICDDCYVALTTGYSIRAQVSLTSEEGDPTVYATADPRAHNGHRAYKVP